MWDVVRFRSKHKMGGLLARVFLLHGVSVMVADTVHVFAAQDW